MSALNFSLVSAKFMNDYVTFLYVNDIFCRSIEKLNPFMSFDDAND